MATYPSERLTKLDVVQRQLRTAIDMFFEERDAVSTYTIAAAVEGVLGDILKRKGIAHPFRESDWIKEGKEKEFNDFLNAPQNFFKHSDRDPDGVLDFPILAVDYLIFTCVVLYQLHTGRVLREGWIFFAWFGTHHPSILKDGPFKDALAATKQRAPDLATAKSTYLQIVRRRDLFPSPNTD